MFKSKKSYIRSFDPKYNVTRIATKDVISCTENASIKSLINTMLGISDRRRKGYRRIPVINRADSTLRGIVTTTDVLGFLGGGPRHGDFISGSGLDSKTKKIMTTRVYILGKNHDMNKTLHTFKKGRRGGYPILDKNRVVGIVSEHDFIKQINRKTGIKVKDLMVRKPIVVKEEYFIHDVAKMMCRGGFRRLPVAHDGILTGIVTPYDILNYLNNNNRLDKLKREKTPIKSIMNVGVVTVRPETEISRAAEIMYKKGIGGLPVTVEDELVGIITERDIVDSLRIK